MASSSQIKLLHFFIKFAAKELKLSSVPNIIFTGDKENKYNKNEYCEDVLLQRIYKFRKCGETYKKIN